MNNKFFFSFILLFKLLSYKVIIIYIKFDIMFII